MNKAIISKEGRVSIKDFSNPKINPRSVIIEQKAFGLNYDDVKVLEGRIQNPNPYGIIGVEASGIVKSVARDCIRDFKVGDRVCYATFNPGAFVLERCVHEDFLIPIPKYATLEQGATLLKGLMAYTLLGKVFILNPKSTILLSGASGGVGTFFVQLASKAGFKVIGLTSKDEKIDFIKQNGAFEVINYKKEDVSRKISSITKGDGVDFFFDCLGGDVENFAFSVLKVRGFFISFGSITGKLKLKIEDQKEKSITSSKVSLSNFITDYENFFTTSLAFFKSMQGHKLTPIIQNFKMEDAENAFNLMRAGKTMGQKIITSNN